MTTTTASLVFYNSFKQYMNRVMDLGTDVLKMLLCTSTYTPSVSSHTVLADITNELSGNGYARQTLGSVVATQTSGTFSLTSSPVVFTASGGSLTARYFVVFDDTVATPTKPLLFYGLLDNTPADVVTTDGNTLTYTPNASGYFTEA